MTSWTEQKPSLSEKETLVNAQLSIFYAKNLDKKHLEEKDICFSRPGDGISPSNKDKYIGKKLTKAVRKGDKLTNDDFS